MNIKKPMPPIFLFTAIVLMAGSHFLVPGRSLHLPFRWVPGVALALIGTALNVLADGLFKRHGTTVKPSFSNDGVKRQEVQSIWYCNEYGLGRRETDPLASSAMRKERRGPFGDERRFGRGQITIE